jgi:hypothetical protein
LNVKTVKTSDRYKSDYVNGFTKLFDIMPTRMQDYFEYTNIVHQCSADYSRPFIVDVQPDFCFFATYVIKYVIRYTATFEFKDYLTKTTLTHFLSAHDSCSNVVNL